MPVSLPISGDELSSPDHSLMHRIIATDPTASTQSLTINSNSDIGGSCFRNCNPTNIISGGDFENWPLGTALAPDGWTLTGAGATVAREASIIKLGTYSAKVTRAGTDCSLNQTVHTAKGIAYWKGNKLTIGKWVYATVASRGRLSVYDGVDTTNSAYHTGDSTWQWLIATHTVSTAATAITVYGQVLTGDTSVYFDGAMCVEGNAVFAFSPQPVVETGWEDYGATSTIVGWSSFLYKQIWTKKNGKTVFVKYYISGTSNSTDASFTLPYANKNEAGGYVLLTHVVDTIHWAGLMYFQPGTATVLVYKDYTLATTFTASGNKTIEGSFFYESA